MRYFLGGKRAARLMAAAALSTAATLASPSAMADDFPKRTVELVNLASAGGGTDVFLRMLGNASREALGQDVAVVSKQGGGGVASLIYLNTRPRDGHTILGLVPAHMIAISQGKGPVKFEDLVPIVMGTEEPIYLVGRTNDFPDIQAVIAKGQEGPVRLGGTQVGTLDWMGAMAFARKADFQKPIYVPFRGGGEVVTNLIGGNIDVGLIKPAVAKPQIDSGELRPLVVLSAKRQDAFPDVPTARELGFDVVLAQTRGLAVLKGTPEEHIAALEKAFMAGMGTDMYKEYLHRYDLSLDSIRDRAEWTANVTEMHKQIQALVDELPKN
ncbi:Bug family tripartite tricarboxylate transporter substrate binding protein [Paracandidimonas soli]|uniref:Bug family tripartite tricarboxylate transporter substrate binding protein n=1 Tax=Paracandidimonas soli TaxID=1917182 RepID=UPI0033416235